MRKISEPELRSHLSRGGFVYNVGDCLCTDDNRLVTPLTLNRVRDVIEPIGLDLFGEQPITYKGKSDGA